MLGETFETSSFHLSNFERILDSKLRYMHGSHCPHPRVSLCNASLACPSQQDQLEGQFLITLHHSLCVWQFKHEESLDNFVLILISSRFGTEPMFSSAITVMAWKHYLSYVFFNPPLCIHVKGVRIHQLLHIKKHSNCWPSIYQCISICIHSFIHSFGSLPQYFLLHRQSLSQRIEIYSSHIRKVQTKNNISSCKLQTKKIEKRKEKMVKIITCSAQEIWCWVGCERDEPKKLGSPASWCCLLLGLSLT